MAESPSGTGPEDPNDEEEQRRLGWEIYYVGNLARELAEKKAREGKTPPPYRPKRANRDGRAAAAPEEPPPPDNDPGAGGLSPERIKQLKAEAEASVDRAFSRPARLRS